MKIIGIDQSLTSTAIVVLDIDTRQLVNFKVLKTKNKTYESQIEDHSYALRIKNLRDSLFEFTDRYSDILVYSLEGMALSRNSTTARPLAGLFYAITIGIIERSSRFTIIPPKTVKKTACSGNASKEEVIASLPSEVYEAFIEAGYKKTTGLADLADAYFVAISEIKKIYEN